MKQLIFISGPMGAGKTTAARGLLDALPHSVMLDGDWCWEQGNHWDYCEDNKAMVMDNIVTLLGRFLDNPHFETVIFSWVMQLSEIKEELLQRLGEEHDFELYEITLTADADTLRGRILAGGRTEADAERAVAYLDFFKDAKNIIDTGRIKQPYVVDAMLRVLNDGAPRCNC